MALLSFSLLLSAFPVGAIGATSLAEGYEVQDLNDTDRTLTPEELALPGYFKPREEPIPLRIPIEPPRPTHPVPDVVAVLVVVDESARWWLQMQVSRAGLPIEVTWDYALGWANGILELGDDPFCDCYGIDFVAYDYRIWYSPSASLLDLLYLAQAVFPKPEGVDVTFILTGQYGWGMGGWCDDDRDAFIMSTYTGPSPLVNIWQHEVSHLYYAPDHDPGLVEVCVMSYFWNPFTRNWCAECTSIITQYRFRFGTIYVY